MNHTSFRNCTFGARAVNRAVGELRRGVAVVLREEAGKRVLVLPAETATPATLEEFLAEMQPGAEPCLLLARSRADALPASPLPVAHGLEEIGGHQAMALKLHAERLDAALLRALADPTLSPADPGQLLAGPADSGLIDAQLAKAGLLLAKLARLLPAVLAAPMRAAGGASGTGGLLEAACCDVIAHAADSAAGLVLAAEARVPLEEASDARVVAFRPPDGGIEHLAILIGRPEEAEAPLVRVHSECFTGDLLGSLRCDCGPQLHQAIRRMAAEGAGVLLYMAQEGRGIGLVNKLRAYTLQDGQPGQTGLDTLDANRALGYGADERSFAAAATMLKRLGIQRVRLLTNNPQKLAGLVAHGIEVAGRVSHAIAANGENDFYLETKARRFGHLLG